jgi:hypothetical protein
MTHFFFYVSGRFRIGAVLLLTAAGGVSAALAAEETATASEQPQSGDPVAAAVAQANPRHLQLQLRPTLIDLGRSSPMVFRGRVSEQASERDSRGLIITRTRFEIDEVLVGVRETRSVALTTLGGRVGSEVMTVTHVPRFVPGPNYIVFTEPGRPTNSTSIPFAEPGRTIGDENRVFIIDAARNIVRTATGRIVLGVDGGDLLLGAFLPADGTDPRSKAGSERAPTVSGEIVAAETASEPEQQLRAVTPEEFVRAIRALDAAR